LLKAGACERDIQQRQFSSIATDAKGVIQIFNVGAERMLATQRQVMNKIRGRISPASGTDHARQR